MLYNFFETTLSVRWTVHALKRLKHSNFPKATTAFVFGLYPNGTGFDLRDPRTRFPENFNHIPLTVSSPHFPITCIFSGT